MSIFADNPEGGVSLQEHLPPAGTPNTVPVPNPQEKPKIVGIYGIQGCGKTTLIDRLKKALGEAEFAFFDGSDIIASVIQGGLDAFQQMDEASQAHHRGMAIEAIAQQCRDSGRVGVVAGHMTFWVGSEAKAVFTRSDLDTYTHIMYLDVPAKTIAEHRLHDTSRSRSQLDVRALHSWQDEDKTQTRDICRHHGIMFLTVPHSPLCDKVDNVQHLLKDIRDHAEGENLRRALKRLDDIITPFAKGLERVLVFDADKTLASIDAAARFWEVRLQTGKCSGNQLKQFFAHSKWGYSYNAFRQATWLYEEIPESDFKRICIMIAYQVRIHPELERLLRQARERRNVRTLVVTSGVRRIWEEVLQHRDLGNAVKVIGGGRISDGFVVTPDVKAAIVTRLQNRYGVRVHAFGDSEVDIPMLKAADEAYVVAGDLETRSKNMDRVLPAALQNGLRARQLLLPAGAPPRLVETLLPISQLDDAFIDNILGHAAKQPSGAQLTHATAIAAAGYPSGTRLRHRQVVSRLRHATDTTAAKLLMTPMRDANLAGVALRGAHQRAGWWVATNLVSDVIGLEEITIRHVQGHSTNGHQLLNEKKTTIVALMRGGEPMALGVSEAFPAAMFVHANRPEDIKSQHLLGKSNIILVDSVVNSGASVLEFIEYIRQMHKSLRIVVVAGVVQANFFDDPPEAVGNDINVSLVALRLSDNGFKGKRGTDTGNRLFNTTHLE